MTHGDALSTKRACTQNLRDVAAPEQSGLRERRSTGEEFGNLEFFCFLVLTFGSLCWCGFQWALQPRLLHARQCSTEIDAATLRQAMTLFFVENPDALCPTTKSLMNGHYVESWTLQDGWDNAFRLSCEGRHVFAVSAGPDEVFGTDDDLR
ncbi:MAG: hypothetical protein AB8H86_05690 [Polyangiales bacterium]